MSRYAVTKKDELGLYMVFDDWIIRPTAESCLDANQRVRVDASSGGGTCRVRLRHNRAGEIWAKKIPYWWHPVEGANQCAKELRETNLRDALAAYEDLNAAFERGQVVA
jgi:hypothetical protein